MMKKAFLLALSIIAVLFLTISSIKNEYYLTGDDKVVCEAILLHAPEFDNQESIKVTGALYDKDMNTVFVSIATRNRSGILVSNVYRIYGESFESMEAFYVPDNEDVQEYGIHVIGAIWPPENLNLNKINNCIRRRLK